MSERDRQIIEKFCGEPQDLSDEPTWAILMGAAMLRHLYGSKPAPPPTGSETERE
jgi:hypothetical protein